MKGNEHKVAPAGLYEVPENWWRDRVETHTLPAQLKGARAPSHMTTRIPCWRASNASAHDPSAACGHGCRYRTITLFR